MSHTFWGRKSAGKSTSSGILPAITTRRQTMTQERLSLRKRREVLRLKHEVGLCNRAIARACRVSNSTVGEYLVRARQADLNWPLPEDLSEEALYQRLFGEKPT